MSRRAPGPERLGALSDGVIAIIITIMVLELHVPHEATIAALLGLWPTFLSYALSYLIVAIVWINHHHLVHHTERATGSLLWTNLLFLFFVSLIPFFTEWMAESRLARVATAMYAVDFVATSLAFILFERQVAAQSGQWAQLGRLRVVCTGGTGSLVPTLDCARADVPECCAIPSSRRADAATALAKRAGRIGACYSSRMPGNASAINSCSNTRTGSLPTMNARRW